MRAALDARVVAWMEALEARQLRDLTFQEVSRALRALSATYVERRERIREGSALSGAGKRAAFALYYAPLHFLLVHQIVSELAEPFTSVDVVLDLGCGTGASAAGWVAACPRPPRVVAIDRHPWVVEEARHTFSDLRIDATVRVDDLTRVDFDGRRAGGDRGRARQRHPPARGTGVLLAYAVNEIADGTARDELLERLLAHARSGGHALIVEPLAGFVAPWWPEWQRAVEGVGGCAATWRCRPPLPPIVEKLGRAAGLDVREIKARTLAF